jgi:hypothetical protein
MGEVKNGGFNILSSLKKATDIRCPTVMGLSPEECNVFKNYHWAVNTPNQKYIDEIPIVILKEYQSNSGPVLENLAYTTDVVVKLADKALKTNAASVNPYLKIYDGIFTGNTYQLPFLSEYNHTVSSVWDEPNDPTDFATTLRGKIGDAMGLFQRGIVETRKVWKSSDSSRYSFSFILYNTYDGNTDIPKNLKFIRTLVHNNLPDRTSFGTMLPPCFYTLEVPGVRYSPMAILEGISVNNIGQVNRRQIPIMKDNTNTSYENVYVNIPDAWEIVISVSELLTESRNIYDATFNKELRSKVSVIDEKPQYTFAKDKMHTYMETQSTIMGTPRKLNWKP